MSTDTQTDTDADGKAASEPREAEHVGKSEACSAGESQPETDDREVWKIHCRECNELVPAKPYCYECGAERPADGDFYVGEEVEGR
jgi:hypothetical protein